MNTFSSCLIAILKERIPELGTRIQPNAIDEGSPTPYLAFTMPEDKPIRSIHGIAGYTTTMTLGLVCGTFAEVQTLTTKVIETLDRATLDGRKLYFVSSKDQFFHDEKLRNLHGKIVTVKII